MSNLAEQSKIASQKSKRKSSCSESGQLGSNILSIFAVGTAYFIYFIIASVIASYTLHFVSSACPGMCWHLVWLGLYYVIILLSLFECKVFLNMSARI
jgi:hypothetical protein